MLLWLQSCGLINSFPNTFAVRYCRRTTTGIPNERSAQDSADRRHLPTPSPLPTPVTTNGGMWVECDGMAMAMARLCNASRFKHGIVGEENWFAFGNCRCRTNLALAPYSLGVYIFFYYFAVKASWWVVQLYSGIVFWVSPHPCGQKRSGQTSFRGIYGISNSHVDTLTCTCWKTSS